MFRMNDSNSHSYTPLIPALGIVREPTIWGFITSEYPGIHDIGLPNDRYVPQPVVDATEASRPVAQYVILYSYGIFCV